MMRRWVFVVGLVALACAAGVGKGQTVAPASPARWSPVWLDIVTTETLDEAGAAVNPALDRRMDVTFTSPGGAVFVVPAAFWGDGNGGGSGSVWRAGLSPDEEGAWSWTVSYRAGSGVAASTDQAAGAAIDVDGLSGSFMVGPPDASAQGYSGKGRLRYVGGHYLRFDDGDYFVKGGVDSPENWLGYTGFDNTFDGGAGPNTPDGLHAFPTHAADWNPGDPDWDSPDAPGANDGRAIIGALNYLATTGVNSIYFLPMNIGGDGKDSWPYVGPGINPSGSPGNDNLRFDVSKLAQWMTFFRHAQNRGLLLHFVLNEAEAPNKRELDGYDAGGNPIDPQLGVERRVFYREMIARFGMLNAVQFNISEEYNLSLNVGAQAVLEWAGFIKSIDPHGIPITVHNAGSLNNPTGGAWGPFLGRPEIDLTSLQQARRTTNWSQVAEAFRAASANAGRPIPVMIDEPGSPTRDFGGDFDAFRKRVIWPILMSGGGGEWFINNRDQSLEDFREFDKIWIETGHAVRFFEENLPFWRMTPDDGLAVNASSSFDGPEVFAATGDVYAVYLPDASAAGQAIDLTLATGAGELRWFNPRSGAFEGVAQPIATGVIAPLDLPPSSADEDWVALVTAEGSTQAEFPIEVAGGTGDGVFAAGSFVSVSYQPSAGVVFDRWTGAAVFDPRSAQTGLVMPFGPTRVTALARADTGAPQLLGLTLIDATTDTPLGVLLDGDVISAAGLPPLAELTVRADVSAPPGSVVFDRDGAIGVQTENVAPYALGGDSGGDFAALTEPLSLGANTITATAFAGGSGGGAALSSASVAFTIVAGLCPGDFNADGFVDQTDLADFARAATRGDASADLNADGSPDAFDGVELLLRIAGGC